MKAKAMAKQRPPQLRLPLPTTNAHRPDSSHGAGAGGREAAEDERNVCSSSGSEQEKDKITKSPYPIGATIDIATGTTCSIGDTTTSARTTTTSTTGAAAATGVNASADRSRDGDGGAGGGEDVRGTSREGTNEEEDRHQISNETSGLVEGQVRSETRRLRSDLSEARSTISDLRADLQTLQDSSRNTIEALASHCAQLATLRSQIATVLAQATAASFVASAVAKQKNCACLEATVPRIELLVSQLRSMVEKQQDEEQQEHQRSTPSPLPPSQSEDAEGQLDGQDNGEKGGTDDGAPNIDEPTILQRSRAKPSAGAAPLVTPPPPKRRNKPSRDSTGTMAATRAIGHDDRGRVGPWGPPTGGAHGGKRRKLSSFTNNAREGEYVRTVTATASSGGAVGCHRSLVEKAFDSAKFPGNGGGIKRRGDLNKVYLIDPIDDDGDGDQMEQGTEMIPETPAVPPSSRPRTVAASTAAGGPSRTNGTAGTNQAASADQSRTNTGKGESHATNDTDAATDQAAANQAAANTGEDKSDATTDADTADQAAADQAAAAVPSRANTGKDKSDATNDTATDTKADTDTDTDTQSIPYTRIPMNRKGKTGRWPSERSEEPSYKYHEVVRNKEKRRAMKGYACEQCRPFVDAIAKGDLKGKHFPNLQEMFCDCSRHRSNHTPQLTPKGFWDLSFADSQESHYLDKDKTNAQ